MLDDAAQASLLRHARAVLGAALSGAPVPPPPSDAALERPARAFVTLRRGSELRGCLGRTSADRALAQVVGDMVVAASRDDPRFPPINRDELEAVTIEISVLDEPVPAPWTDVEPGRHGVIVGRGRRRALLLPQVAVEHGWTREQLLDAACRKAGLPAAGWREGQISIERFEAQVFAE